MNKSKSSTANAGQYFVAAELAKMGHIALITMQNTENVDILVSNAAGTRTVNIQVKTQSANGHSWPLNEKAERTHSPSFFYVFVALGSEGERPEYFIVPSKVVAEAVSKNHTEWLAQPGRNGQPHKDNPVRKFDDYQPYREQWSILGL